MRLHVFSHQAQSKELSNTVKPLLTDTPPERTPLYKGQKLWYQRSKYSVNEPLQRGHPAIMDKFSGTVSVHYSRVSL